MKNPSQQANIVEPSYFSNWADLFMPPLANKLLLPLAKSISFISPNMVTLSSFVLYSLGAIALFLAFPYHLLVSAILLPVSYLLDCLDGQLARTKKQFSPIGDYLDKTLDVLKIYILTISLGYAVYLSTHEILPLLLAFTTCFFFNFRYYIKLETIFNAVNKDEKYLERSSLYRKEQYVSLKDTYTQLKKTPVGFLKYLWYRNRIIIFIDEAEFVLFTSIAAIINQLNAVLWIFAISQVSIAIFRLFERAYQISNRREDLLKPMRK